MSKQDPVTIATVSIIVITLSLSLVSIYVLPSIYYNININRNTEKGWEIKLIQTVEVIDGNSTLFDSLNRSVMIEKPLEAIVNITKLITYAEQRIGYVNHFENLGGLQPKRIKLTYNASLESAKDNATYYVQIIKNMFASPHEPTYLAYLNSDGDYEAYSNFEEYNTENIDIENMDQLLSELFKNPSTRPDYVIYQEVSYLESYGLLTEYSTQFVRLVFINVFGDVQFFMCSDGNWLTPIITAE